MRATELRIGNLVAFNHKWDIISKVEEIQQHSVRVSFDTQPNLMNALITNPENFIPIPLTEEWLLKFGFEKSEKDKEGYQIWIFNGDECIFRIKHIIYFYLCDTNYFGTEIRYVHDIQNLYFAMTGQELTLNEKL